jgi:predicted esterase
MKAQLPIGNGHDALQLTWLIPKLSHSSPRALVILQHGMMRHAENMMSLAEALVSKNIEVMLPSISDEQYLNTLFPEEFAESFSKLTRNPAGQTLPAKLLLVGFSAGARFLSHAAGLIRNTQNIRGVLLLDPVVGHLPEQQLGPQLSVPYFTILGRPSRCNAEGSVFPLLESGQYQARGFRLKTASHCDFEGRSSDFLCYMYCGFSPKKNTRAIEIFVSEWVSGLIDNDEPDFAYLPGGKVFEHWQNQGIFDSVFN